MWRTLLRWLAPLFVAGACMLPTAHGQAAPRQRPGQGGSETEDAPSVPALQYAAASVSLILVMVIVLMPSRKRS